MLDSGATLAPGRGRLRDVRRRSNADALERRLRLPRADRRRARGRPPRRPDAARLVGHADRPGQAASTPTGYFVVCPNLLGGCNGTTGPVVDRPGDRARPTGCASRTSRSRDLVTVHRRAARATSAIERLHGAIGGSLGGMQVLQWAIDHPGRARRTRVLVCALGAPLAPRTSRSRRSRARRSCATSTSPAATTTTPARRPTSGSRSRG